MTLLFPNFIVTVVNGDPLLVKLFMLLLLLLLLIMLPLLKFDFIGL